MDTISTTMKGQYFESKIVSFGPVGNETYLADNVLTYEDINAEVSKFIKDGWMPVNLCVDGAWYTILFCR